MQSKSDEQNLKTSETKFEGKGILSATDFGSLIGCTVSAVTKMFGKKLTEGVSYLRDGNSILIDVEKAREELRMTVNIRTCKNEKLLQFLDLPKMPPPGTIAKLDLVADMDTNQVREEMRKSELRISLINERVLEGKYIERAAVEKNLEAIGMEIRNTFTGISARVTPQMRAAATDRDAENIVHKAIEDALISISNIAEKDLTA